MVATSVGWGQTDLYVSTSGSDGNGGGVEAPLATIAKAIEKPQMGLPFVWQREFIPKFHLLLFQSLLQLLAVIRQIVL